VFYDRSKTARFSFKRDKNGEAYLKLIYKGLSKLSGEIPQPISVVLGSNLRQNSKPQSLPKAKDKQGLEEEPARSAMSALGVKRTSDEGG
jgi:hypothetical protein